MHWMLFLAVQATTYIDDKFFEDLIPLAGELGAAPEDIAAVAFAESGLHASARSGECVGINMMCPGTLRPYAYTSPEHFVQLPASKQLVAFGRLLRARRQLGEDVMVSARNIYWANFLPVTYASHASDNRVLTCSAGLVRANHLIAHGKRCIVAGDLSRFLAERQQGSPDAWAEVLKRIKEARERASASD